METKDLIRAGALTLRRNLYFVLSLLLADDKMGKIKDVTGWTNDFHESEVRRLML